MRFVSKRLEPRYVMIPEDRIIDEQRRVQRIKGKKAEFHNHQYFTDDPEMIDFLLNHQAYGIEFVSDQPEAPVKNVRPPDIPVPAWETDDVLRKEMEKAKKEAVPMIQGAMSTGQATQPPQVAVVTKEQVVQLIEEKMTSLNDKLDNLILVLSAEKAPAIEKPKPKKEFHCPICRAEFRSGVEVGKHKKQAHPSN